jgi:medium-chain acyl-[acyl-carrier-protein] hydrolase
VSAPGREHRISEPVPDRLADHVRAVATALADLADVPFALFGHSMGAMVAYETARRLHRSGRPLPVRLWVSACPAPSIVRENEPEHLLNDPDLLAFVRGRYGGFPAEVEEYPEVLTMALGVLRGDLRALATHPHRPSSPLPVPISAVGGDADPSVPASALRAWESTTSSVFRFRLFSGTHRYLETAQTALLAYVGSELRELARGSGAGTDAASTAAN